MLVLTNISDVSAVIVMNNDFTDKCVYTVVYTYFIADRKALHYAPLWDTRWYTVLSPRMYALTAFSMTILLKRFFPSSFIVCFCSVFCMNPTLMGKYLNLSHLEGHVEQPRSHVWSSTYLGDLGAQATKPPRFPLDTPDIDLRFLVSQTVRAVFLRERLRRVEPARVTIPLAHTIPGSNYK